MKGIRVVGIIVEVAYLLVFFFISFLLPAKKKKKAKTFTNFLRNFLKYCRENSTCFRYLKKCWDNKLLLFTPLPWQVNMFVCVTLLLPSPISIHSLGKPYSLLLYCILSLWTTYVSISEDWARQEFRIHLLGSVCEEKCGKHTPGCLMGRVFHE